MRFAILVASLAMFSSPLRADTVDQSYLTPGLLSHGRSGSGLQAQTFTAGLSGLLSEVQLQLIRGGSPTGPFEFQVRRVVGGIPNAVLFSTMLDVASLPLGTGHDGFIPPTSIDVSAAGIAVAPGTQLALVTGPGTNMLWHYVETDAYGPGRSLQSTGALISWDVFREGDFTFRTSIVEGLVKPALVEIEFMPLPVFGVLNRYTATAVGGVGPLSYRWDFDGDGRYEAFGQDVEHAFPTLGTHVFGLQITDATGVTTTTSLTVTTVTPEPSTLLLLLCGAAVALCVRMRRRVSAAGSARGSTGP